MCHFRVNRSSRANNFFRSCRYNTAAISETKIGFEHIFEIGIFKGIRFCLRGKSFKVLAMIVFFSLFVSQFFEMILCVLAGLVHLICWSGRELLSFSFNSLNCISRLVLLCFFTSSNFFSLYHFAAFSAFCVLILLCFFTSSNFFSLYHFAAFSAFCVKSF